MKREFILLKTMWHMVNGNATNTRCYMDDPIPKLTKVIFTDKPPKPLCRECEQSAARLLADMVRCSRRPNRPDILSRRFRSENSPRSTLVPYCEKTTIAKAKLK